MATYNYTAKDAKGNALVGTYDNINSVALLRKELEKVGYILVKARRQKNSTQGFKRIKQLDVVTFIYKFAEMYSAGLSITRILEVLQEQNKNSTFSNIIADIRQNVENGLSLEKSFKKHSYLFSDFFSGMLEAGESGGNLTEALKLSAVYLEKQMDLRRKLKSAFTYPIVVGAVCLLVVGCLIAFIVPIFSKLYKQLHVPLPGPTYALVLASSLLRNYWWVIPIVFTGLIIILRRLSKNSTVKKKWDLFKLNMPVLGTVNHMVMISHFTRTLGMLTSVGVSPIRALDVASVVAHNHKMNDIAKELQVSIEKGYSIGKALKKFAIFPPMIVQLALSGEEVGHISEMLNKGADFLDKDIDRSINSLLVKLEPALTVFMGTIVGFILMAVYLPMFDYMRYLE
jgi:type IV pilus assembly protein PilC